MINTLRKEKTRARSDSQDGPAIGRHVLSSPVKSPFFCSGKINEVATEYLFIPYKRERKIIEEKPKGEIKVLRTRDWVRESITRGEGISTPHVHSTLRDPLSLF